MINPKTFLIALAVAVVAIYLLSPILLPFVAGIIIAYLLSPMVEKMVSFKFISRPVASFVPIFIFMFFSVGILALGIPLISDDIARFVKNVPRYAAWLESALSEGGVINVFLQSYGIPVEKEEVVAQLYSYSDQIALLALDTLQGTALGALALFDLFSLLIITPLVVFYLLLDWQKFVASTQKLFPSKQKGKIMETIKEVDRALSAFLRGQGSVCLLLGLFYGLALWAAGLQMGFFIGLVTGILSFIPYVGMLLGLVVASIVAVMQYQFGAASPYLIIAGIFVVGQLLEGFYLTPKLVGEKVGLHPVWVIFAVMAGGELGGFLGVLIALPVATILSVIIPKLIFSAQKGA